MIGLAVDTINVDIANQLKSFDGIGYSQAINSCIYCLSTAMTQSFSFPFVLYAIFKQLFSVQLFQLQ